MEVNNLKVETNGALDFLLMQRQGAPWMAKDGNFGPSNES